MSPIHQKETLKAVYIGDDLAFLVLRMCPIANSLNVSGSGTISRLCFTCPDLLAGTQEFRAHWENGDQPVHPLRTFYIQQVGR